jgi:hypothetical protein
MPLASIALRAKPGPIKRPAALHEIWVGISKSGRWVVREATGRFGALFREKRDALRYARREAGPSAAIVIVEEEPIELPPLEPAHTTIRSLR